MNGIEPKLNKNFIFKTRKNSAVILIIVKAFWAVMYQIPVVNDHWPPVISTAASSKACQAYKMIRGIDAYLATLTGAQLGKMGWTLLLFFFFENWKKCSNFGREKSPDCVHFWIKFSIQNVVLRTSWRMIYKMFLCRVIFSCFFFMKCLLKRPNSIKPPLPWKSSCYAPARALFRTLFIQVNASIFKHIQHY